ncbi:MAG: bifunctional DNA-formamidopyrimidine glycosylase/DNA-(apurinic or apyrimidinic site) lyase [Paracoccaceae bacterium]|nr:bifunctional DNA-formamidopyrimidine glycosylase/DNA-(apurinic or apyrimidinic site) lyase [Paracoccaceae bacterium]MDE2914771.1 bifunctional DNA-formamidopyrimidine glycosylase/DNA-(apurinic or apyrimidinic site) lyase [Paracoccaceae bacterium]
MPELPEVETIRRGLEPAIADRRIHHAEFRRSDLRWPLQPDLAERLSGARVDRLWRRSKFLLMDLSTDETLMIHLGMSGRLRLDPARGGKPAGRTPVPPSTMAEDGRHDHAVFRFEGGSSVIYTDPRRFGMIELVPTPTLHAHPLLASLGPEPLGNGFSEPWLDAQLAGRQAPIKAVLLDQRVVAGLGNIYASEALWRSGISPRRRARTVAGRRASRLFPAIREVLREAIEAGGSSLRDYRQADGELGYFQHAFAVYGRDGEPCLKSGCDGVIRRIRQAGRSTFLCPCCQR